MKAKDFDQAFEQGEGITKHLDLSTACRSRLQQKRVNIDLPMWMVHQLDKEANRLGVTRQSIIKTWLAEHLKKVLHG